MISEILWMSKHSIKSFLSQGKKWSKDRGNWKRFWQSYYNYKNLASAENQPSLKYLFPCLGDDLAETPIEPTYFYQDCWAFEKIIKQSPQSHIDVGSHHKFVALLSKVIPVTMVDIRPLSLPLDSLSFKKGSILDLPFEDNSIESLSSLCVIEHIGLGRYGDPLDPKGTEKAIAELKRVIKPQGYLYISLLIDDENITFFNAHRAYKEDYLESLFSPFQLIEKAYIYGNQFTHIKQTGFGVGLYCLQNIS